VQKSLRLRAIFAELREAGVEASARDLLRIANYILQTFAANGEEIDLSDTPMDPRAFFALPLDKAMEDGGWRVLEFEARRHAEVQEMSPEARTLFVHCIRKALGPEWQYRHPQD
jgi:hypothetical protein